MSEPAALPRNMSSAVSLLLVPPRRFQFSFQHLEMRHSQSGRHRTERGMDNPAGVGITPAAMDESASQPEKRAIPLPDLTPPPPSPSLDRFEPAKPASHPPPAVGAGGIPVRVVTTEDDNEAAAGDLAPFNTRIIAAVIDLVVAGGVQMALAWILPGFTERLAWLAGIAYLVTRDSLPMLGGQSVGKKAMKLKVVTGDDQALTGNWQTALIRNGVLLIPLFAFIELYILLTREEKPERGLRLGDEWAKTRVIIAPDPPAV